MLSVNSTLQTLDLRINDVGDDGAREIAAALRVNSTLQTLNLRSALEVESSDLIEIESSDLIEMVKTKIQDEGQKGGEDGDEMPGMGY